MEELQAHGSESKRSLIYLAFHACAADGGLHPGERDMIHKIASQIEIPEEVVNQLETHYEEERALRQKRLHLLFDLGKPF